MKFAGAAVRVLAVMLTIGAFAGRAAAQAPPNGEALFKAHCAMCHNDAATGANRAPSPAVLAGKTQEEILRALNRARWSFMETG